MRERLPWAAAALGVVVLAGVLGWSMATPVATPTSGWKIIEIRSTDLPTVLAAGIPQTSGIENIHYMKTGSGYDKSENLTTYVGNSTYWMATYTGSGWDGSVAYEVAFDVVVVVKGHSDNMAYATKENLKAELGLSGDIVYSDNSTDLMEYVFENENYGSNAGWLRVNAVFDNNGNGWTLRAGDSAPFTVKLWQWA